MTHDELLAEIDYALDDSDYNYDFNCADGSHDFMLEALRAVVELHKPEIPYGLHDAVEACPVDGDVYPCPTIQAIEKELR